MSSNSSAALPKFNLPLALLWLVAVAAGVTGYVILSSSNAAQAAFYAEQSADYGTYFQAQSGSFLGSILIGAGVIGVIIALASHVGQRPVAAVLAEPEFSDDELFLDEHVAEADNAAYAHAASTTDAPAAETSTTNASTEAPAETEVAPTTAR